MWPSLNPLRCALVESPAPVGCKYLQFGHKNIHIRITQIMRSCKYSKSDKTHQCGKESPDKTHIWVFSDCEHLLPGKANSYNRTRATGGEEISDKTHLVRFIGCRWVRGWYCRYLGQIRLAGLRNQPFRKDPSRSKASTEYHHIAILEPRACLLSIPQKD